MRLAIDGSNIRAGGGLNHLSEILVAGCLRDFGFEGAVVWGARQTLDRLPTKPGIELVHEPALDRSIVHRLIWQRQELPRRLAAGFDLLFVPSGIYLGPFRPFVAMSQNLLPFDNREIRRYATSKQVVRLLLLRAANRRTYRRADSTIYLTRYARDRITGGHEKEYPRPVVIPYGVDPRFRREPRPQRSIASYSDREPYRLLYVSTVNRYKHQWNVVEAVGRLRAKGLPIALDLVGPSQEGVLPKLMDAINRVDPSEAFVKFHGPVPYAQIHTMYENADAFVFASSCESFGQIVLEAMSSGLPIACSNRSALPEVLNGSGLLFDPEDVADIARGLEAFVLDSAGRQRLAETAFAEAQRYSWKRCADETFAYLAEIARTARCDARSKERCG